MLSLSETGADIGGRFDNIEAWYDPRTWGRSKVAPEPGSVDGTSEESDTNAHERMDTLSELSTTLQEKEQHLIEKERDLQEREELLRVEKEKSRKESELLQEEKAKIQKENTDLQEREGLLRVEKKTFQKEREQKLQEEMSKIQKEYARIQKEDSVLFVERDRLSTLKMSLDRQEKDLELTRKNIQDREEKIQGQLRSSHPQTLPQEARRRQEGRHLRDVPGSRALLAQIPRLHRHLRQHRQGSSGLECCLANSRH
jgi:uncharacterized protein (DUF3084 family)